MFDTDNLTTIFCQQNVPTETAMRNGAEVTSGSPPKPVNNTLKIMELLCCVETLTGSLSAAKLVETSRKKSIIQVRNSNYKIVVSKYWILSSTSCFPAACLRLKNG